MRVRNLDEKERRKVDQQLDQVAISTRLRIEGGADPRHRHRRRPGPTMPTSPDAAVIETGRFRKVVPDGFTAAELARDAEAVRAFVAKTGGGG